MALVKKRSNTTRTLLIAVVVVIVAGVAYFLFQEFFLKNEGGEANVNRIDSSHSVITNFGESMLNDSRFTNLKTFGTNVSADANVDGGQDNPFR